MLEACSRMIELGDYDIIYHDVYLINKIDVILRWRKLVVESLARMH